MIDQFSIFHRGGAVLWERTLTPLPSTPISSLISSVLLQERAASTSHRVDRYDVRWTFANDFDLVFVAVYLNLTHLLYIDELLERVKAEFVRAVQAQVGGGIGEGGKGWGGVGGLRGLPVRVEFDGKFDRIVQGFEMDHLRGRGQRGPRTFEEAKKGTAAGGRAGGKKKKREGGGTKGADEEGEDEQGDEGEDADGAANGDATVIGATEATLDAPAKAAEAMPPSLASPAPGAVGEVPKGLNVEKLRQMQAIAMRGGPRPMRSGPPSKKKGSKDTTSSPSSSTSSDAADDGKKKRVKQATKWADKISKEDAKALDFTRKAVTSGGSEGEEEAKAPLDGVELAKKYGFIDKDDTNTIPTYSDDDEDEDSSDPTTVDDADDTAAPSDPSKPSSRLSSSMFSLFSRLAGTSVLTREQLEPVLAQFRTSLMAKNVAHEIAEKLCDSVAVSLEGKRLGYSTVRSTVYRAIDEALTRILTPSKQVDIAQGIAEAKAARRPYSIVFLGVNGVGKCFARGTRVRLYNGDTMAVEEVVGGERLMGDDSTPRIVDPASVVRGRARLYEIQPKWKGAASFTVNGAHILVLVNNAKPHVTPREGGQWRLVWYEIVPGNRMMKKSRTFATEVVARAQLISTMADWEPLLWEVSVENFLHTGIGVQRVCTLVASDAITFSNPQLLSLRRVLGELLWAPPSAAQLDYMAWWLGMWVSDGVKDRASIAQGGPPAIDAQGVHHHDHHEEIMARLEAYAGLFHEPVDKAFQSVSSAGWDVFWFNYRVGSVAHRVLQRYGLLNRKRIPRALICDSLGVRLRFLAGIIDGDGHHHLSNVYELPAKERVVVDGFKELAATLGLRNAGVQSHVNTNQQTGEQYRGYRVRISGHMWDVAQYCATTYKRCPQPGAADYVEKSNDSRCYGLKITPLPTGEYFGFAVHGVNRRFLLEDYTVTHNSTSLAKVAAYFLSKQLTVGIAACDTFRSGAIEQLRTHCQCLGVPLYAKGYDRDAAFVASEAIASARKDGLDVVLIDTAGRMQDNEPLMRALSKLITLNAPDLILFVGEALVGNDAVDQAAKFNRCLSDLSGDAQPRLIDGIVLTKFDTIDDKVGAAISMAYTTGRPIMFVGTGQTYKDLKRMNSKTLIKALLK